MMSIVLSFQHNPIEYSINPDPSIARVDVTFLLKNRTSFIIDHINIHCIDSMSSKLLNTTIVEKINSAASLYAETILGQRIALLFKSINSQNDILIDGKSTEIHYLSNLMEEIKTSLK
ncbi:unnamed protein product [Rotaria sordida]|uniref:AP-3 complex subunit delta Mu C-terminal domain-containing protein n=1 Tax=Rotaria sordida TaxID=392033 RepID=A0A814UMK7_9BILA|nr:unnamed protein product [Rotaria sordida]